MKCLDLACCARSGAAALGASLLLFLGACSSSKDSHPNPPAITTQPASVTVVQGAAATLQVVATGQGTLSYQWFKDGASLAGKNGATLTIAAATLADAGSYLVSVTLPDGNGVQETRSQAAKLGVNAPPALVTQPQDQWDDVGGSALLAVQATGNGALTYQWQKDGQVLTGQTADILYLSPLRTSDAGTYAVTVSNSLDSTVTRTVSQTARVILASLDKPAITLQPQSLTAALGAPASFTCAATGSGSLSYQWLKNGLDLRGQTAATLALPAVTIADQGFFQVQITNTLPWGASATLSAVARLTVNPGTGAFTLLSVLPGAVSLALGGEATAVVSIQRSNHDFPITFGLQNAPAGITASGVAAGLMDIALVNLQAAYSTLPGVQALTLTASDGVTTRTLPLPVTVTGSGPLATAAKSYTLTYPPTLTIPAGAATTVNHPPSLKLAVRRDNGHNSSITLALKDPPAGISGQVKIDLDPEAPLTNLAFMPITVAASVVPGTYPLTFTATDGSATSEKALALTVLAQGEVPPMGAYRFLYAGYNPDGTFAANPVEFDTKVTVNQQSFILKRLAGPAGQITFDKKAYTVYAATPERMTIGYAYRNQPESYFDPTAIKAGFPTPTGSINLGKPTTLAKTTGVLSTGELYLATNTGIGSVYCIPALENTKTPDGSYLDHAGLTENVEWLTDAYCGIEAKQGNNTVTHVIQYGWSLKPLILNEAIVWRNLKNDGNAQWPDPKSYGYILNGNVTNHFFQSLTGDYTQTGIKAAIDEETKGTASFPADVYPFPDPTPWLKKGLFMPYMPQPGFQVNLIRSYTPAGSWELLSNTSGLFMRGQGQVGAVEIPAVLTRDGQAARAYPLVVQTWKNQRFTVLNSLAGDADAIAGVITDYPGLEWYNLMNVFLPGKAGVITTSEHYTVDDNNGAQTDRQSDCWLGLRGDTVEEASRWDDANGQEPGGQANKPYMLGAGVTYNKKGAQFYGFRMEHSNSFLAPSFKVTDLANKLYSATIYVDTNGSGYRKAATLSWNWMPWSVDTSAADKIPRWKLATVAGQGMMVPQVVLDKDFGIDANSGQFDFKDGGSVLNVLKDQAVSWDASNVIGWGGAGTTFSNLLGQPVQRYKVVTELVDASIKVLVVLGN